MRRLVCLLLALSALGVSGAGAQDFDILRDTRPRDTLPAIKPSAAFAVEDTVRVLIVGDSWAQYMWDDGSHDDLLDRFGFDDRRALSLSLAADPGPGYSGPEVAISGSEARQWADTANYPWIANMVALLQANPTIDWVVLSIGGNDVLAGRSDGGWYKDMDLDVPGSEAALFDRIHDDTFAVIDAALAVRPSIKVLISSYDYPNFNTGLFCFLYACPKRRDLSRDPDNDLITDAELNGMMITVETRRIAWAASHPRILFDNAVGYMHYAYGDGVTGPRLLPKPGVEDPDYPPFPGGNPDRPSLRSNFRNAADPIHLSLEGYRHKIGHQTWAHFVEAFRAPRLMSLVSEGGVHDGWSDGVGSGTDGIRVGDNGLDPVAALISFDTSALPTGAVLTGATLFLTRRSGAGANPFVSGALGAPIVDLAGGHFGDGPEPEPADATAPADAPDTGRVIGSVRDDAYTLRVEIDAAGLAAIDPGSRVQIRLRFPVADPGTDEVEFHDGDAGPWTPTGPATLAGYLGEAKPLLDLDYELPLAAANPPDTGFRLAAPYPNPFNPSTRLEFHLPRDADVRLEIYDLQGRLIRRLVDAHRPAGPQTAIWDGLDGQGRATPSGLYLARLSAGNLRDSRRLSLVR